MTQKNDLWASLPPDPKLVARQLAALREWLARPLWTPNQAACIFAGVLPSERLFDKRPFGGYLPPKSEWHHAKEIEQAIFAERIAELETLLGEAIPNELRTPENYISLGLKLGFMPEWLDYARNDEETRKFLPLNALGEAKRKAPLSGREIASLGGKARKASKRAKWFPQVKKRLAEGKKPAEILHAM